MMPSIIFRKNKRQIIEIFSHYPMFSNIRIIGSFERHEDTPDCDIDFYIDASEEATLFDLGNLIEDLENSLNIPVDVKTSASKLAEKHFNLLINNWEEIYE